MRRIVCFVLSLALIPCAVGCSQKPSKVDVKPPTQEEIKGNQEAAAVPP